MKYFSERPFDHPTQVSHEGKIIAFAVATESDSRGRFGPNDVCYRVLDVKPEVPRDEDNWSPLQKVTFSELVQPIGMELIRVPAQDAHAYTGTPFSVLSDGRHVYIFRQSKGGTLLVSRFLLLEVLDEERGEKLPTLQIPWEVRYQRSKKRAIPASDKDSIGFKDMEDNPFQEPTFELTVVNQLAAGRFDVLIVPTNVPNKERWYIFSISEATHSLRISSLPRAPNGLFVVARQDKALLAQLETQLKAPLETLEAEQLKAQLAAELDKFSEQIIELQQEGKTWRPAKGLASLLYFQQVADIDDYGREQILKRNGRLMLALGGSATEVAAAELAVALDFSGEENGYPVNEDSTSTGDFPFDGGLQLGSKSDEKVENPEISLPDGNSIEFESEEKSYQHTGSYVIFEPADSACTFTPWNGTIEIRVKFPKELPERRMALVGFTGNDQYANVNNHIGFYWVLENKRLAIWTGVYKDDSGTMKLAEHTRLFEPKKAIDDSFWGDGGYHHLAVTFSKDANTQQKTVTFYVDGQVHESNSLPQDGWTSTGGLWSIGCQQIKAENVRFPRDRRPGPFAVDRFKGWIGEVAVWNVAKDAAFIANRVSNKLTGAEANLVGFVPAGITGDGNSVINKTTGVSGTIVGESAREEINATTAGLIAEPLSPTTQTSYLSFTQNTQPVPQFSAIGGTVELWLKTAKTERQALLDFSGSATDAGVEPKMGLVLFLEDNRLVVRHGHWAKQIKSPPWTGILADEKWHHIALRFERPDPEVANYVLTFLVDGKILSSQAANTIFTFDTDSAGPLRGIGYRCWNNRLSKRADPFKGQITQVRIWNIARTSAEITQQREQLIAADADGLVSNLTFTAIDGAAVPNGAKKTPNRTMLGELGTGVTVQTTPVPALSLTPYVPSPAMAVLDWAIQQNGTLALAGGEVSLQALEEDTLAVTAAPLAAYLLPPANTRGTPSLLEGADGLVHLYFAGPKNGFSVAQYRPLLESTGAGVTSGPANPPTGSATLPTLTPTGDPATPVTLQSRIPTGLSFDGRTNYAELENLPLGSSFTIELWINPQVVFRDQAFVAKHRADGSNLFLFGYRAGGLHVELNHPDGTAEYTAGEKVTGLQHLAVTVKRNNATHSTVSVYRNGQPVWAQTMNAVLTDWSGKPWVIGLDWDRDQSASERLRGQLFTLNVWDTARTDAQIQADFRRSPAVDAPDLIAAYRFEPGSEPLRIADRVDPTRFATLRSSDGGDPAQWVPLDEITLPSRPFLDLNGVDEYVELTDFSLASSFTVEMWVNPRSVDGKQAFLAKHDANGATSWFNFGYRPEGVHVELNGKAELAYGTKLTGWQHLAVVVEKTRGAQAGPHANRDVSRVMVFRNGRPLWSAEFPTVITQWTGRPWLLGQEWDGNNPSDFLDGEVAELRFWDHARSVAAIGEGIDTPPADDAPGLVAYYRTESGADPAVLADRTGAARHGRLVTNNPNPAEQWGQYAVPVATPQPTFPLTDIAAGARTETWWQLPRDPAELAALLNDQETGSDLIRIDTTNTPSLPEVLSLGGAAPSAAIQGRWKPQLPGLALQLPGKERIGLDTFAQQSNWPLDLQRALTLEAWVRPGTNTGSRLKILHIDRAEDARLALGFLPDGNGSVSIRCAGLLSGDTVSPMHNPESNDDGPGIKFTEALYPCIGFDPNAANQASFSGDSGTVECWIKTRKTDTLADGSVVPLARQCLVSFYGEKSETTAGRTYADDSISINLENNRITVRREHSNLAVLSPEFGKEEDPDLMDGEWHYIAVIFSTNKTTFLIDDMKYDPASELQSIFDDKQDYRKASGGLKSIGGHLYKLGYDYVYQGQSRTKKPTWIDPFKGYLGEVRIWNTARGQTELIHNRLALTGNKNELTGHYLPKEVKTIVIPSDELTVEGFRDRSLDKTVYKLYNEVDKTNDALAGTLGENTRKYESNVVALSVSNHAHACMAPGLTLTQDRWMHLAATYRDSYSLVFDAALEHFIDCGNNTILKAPKELTLEAWVRPEKGSQLAGTLLSKMSPTYDERGYQLSIDNNGFVNFEIYVSEPVSINGQDTRKITQRSRAKLPDGPWNHLAVTCQAATDTTTKTTSKEGGGEETTLVTETFIRVQLFINGAAQSGVISQKFAGDISFQTNDAPLWLGRSSDAWRPGYLNGEVGTVRIWGRPLKEKEIARTVRLRKVADDQDKLFAHWTLASGIGLTLFDVLGINHGRISHTGMWRISDLHAGWSLFLDGERLPTFSIPPTEHFATHQQQFSLGGKAGDPSDAFTGILDDLRLWSGERTQEEISDSMHRQLTGDEKKLAAYWHFDERGRMADGTGHFLELTKLPANWWVATDSPTGFEGPAVQNVIRDSRKVTQAVVKGVPSALEYGDMQINAKGQLFGVLKRHYLYQGDDGRVLLRTGFKVGSLDLCYIGQVQTAPTLVGYIEGAPPVPSENLTVNDLFTDDYVGASKIELIEAENTLSAYSSSSDKGSHTFTEYTVGALVNTELSVMGLLTVDLDMKAGYKNQVEVTSGTLHNSAVKTGSTRTITRALELVGSWEEKGKELNPDVGRRYVPDNVGYALVKSRTSDLYALKLKHSNTIIAYETLINPDIPEDWNIIMFPIDPDYTINGDLDSYAKHREAYALKEEIEREREELLALYEQFDAEHRGTSNDQRELLSERWKNKIAKRSMVNTYVWTAGGGLYAEEESTLSVRTESIGGTYARKTTEGFQMEGSVVLGGAAGAYGSYDSLNGQYQNFTVMKEKEDARSFSLKVDLTGEGFLKKWSNDADPGREDPNGYYLPEDTPGKVSAYRFMTFYLSPQESYFDTFFNEVVDQRWLWEEEEAAALREAKAANNGVWRVLHRVTYVNRIKPGITPPEGVKNTVKKIIPAINQEQNQRLLDLTIAHLRNTPEINTKTIAAAIETTLNGDLDPEVAWWTAYWATATNTASGKNLRKDLEAYLRFFYGLE